MNKKQILPSQKDINVFFTGAWVVAKWVTSDPIYPHGVFYIDETGEFIEQRDMGAVEWKEISI